MKDENAAARLVMKSQKRETKFPSGMSGAVRRKNTPTYIRTRKIGENIAVEIIERRESDSNEIYEMSKVAVIAKKEDKNGAPTDMRKRFSVPVPFFFRFSVISEKAIIPSVANADNHKDKSKTE